MVPEITLAREDITQGEVKKEESQGLGELPVFQGGWKRSRIKMEDIWEKEAEDHGAVETMDECSSRKAQPMAPSVAQPDEHKALLRAKLPKDCLRDAVRA